MKKLLVAVSVMLLGFSANAQKEFEGKIVYEIKMEMPFLEKLMLSVLDTFSQAEKDAKMAEFRHSMDSLMSGTEEYYYKNGSYKTVTTFTALGLQSMQYYDAKKKVLYEYNPAENTATYFSVTEAEEGVADKLKPLNQPATVLGNTCKAVQLSGTTYTYKAWYAPGKCTFNPENFKDHLYQGFNVYAATAKAQPLKFRVESELVNIVAEAIEIKEMPVKDEEFVVPNCKKTKTKPTNPLLDLGGSAAGGGKKKK